MFSIWEQNSFSRYDVVVLGGGIVGLSTAYFVKQKYPSQRVLVLERGILPSGASTKNAGFACMGSASELLNDLKTMSEQEVIALFMLRKKGLERLRRLLGDTAIGYQANGSYELIQKHELEVLERLPYLNQLLRSELNTEAFREAKNTVNTYGFDERQAYSMIQNTCEGEIDTGWMMRNLTDLTLQQGIEIKTGCKVLHFHEGSQEVQLDIQNPIGTETITLFASKLIVCTNAFASTLLPDLDITPGRGQVLITKPIQHLPFKGIFHFDQGYYYFREYRGCLLLGGGRNLAMEKEATLEIELNHTIQSDLEEKLRTLIIPNNKFDIALRWAGIMAFGPTKQPIIQQYSNRIFIGVRMGGMGIAIGAEVAHQLHELI
jgi:gamma-glutamylputrescine oxidase